ncbi:hypothetical protein [Nocardioides renjunii]|uniref:hypothetical protein n=1 Tax=Nocardioides renjunii TaxID=3095075 RepID=UPI002AFEACFB|nr:hypothetical protein [Nocardioides sp. S-34]WQQ23100.1 hypothetical protein SHK17_03790 [Nocardioides sp. S-34]
MAYRPDSAEEDAEEDAGEDADEDVKAVMGEDVRDAPARGPAGQEWWAFATMPT